MRSDIQYVVIERPRAGLGVARLAARKRRRKNNDQRNWDGATRTESMGRWDYYDQKSQTDFLEPIYGLLRKRCGTPWNDVYSEIRSVLNSSSTTHAHVFGHLKEAVELNVWIGEDGEPWVHRGHSAKPERLVDAYRYGRHGRPNHFWVHPVSGLLLEMPKPPPEPAKRIDRDHIIDGKRVFHRFDGIWFELGFADLPEGIDWDMPKKTPKEARLSPITGAVISAAYVHIDYGPRDVLIGPVAGGAGVGEKRRYFVDYQHNRREALKLYGRDNVYAATKGRQLNTKDLHRLKVKNEPEEGKGKAKKRTSFRYWRSR